MKRLSILFQRLHGPEQAKLEHSLGQLDEVGATLRDGAKVGDF